MSDPGEIMREKLLGRTIIAIHDIFRFDGNSTFPTVGYRLVLDNKTAVELLNKKEEPAS